MIFISDPVRILLLCVPSDRPQTAPHLFLTYYRLSTFKHLFKRHTTLSTSPTSQKHPSSFQKFHPNTDFYPVLSTFVNQIRTQTICLPPQQPTHCPSRKPIKPATSVNTDVAVTLAKNVAAKAFAPMVDKDINAKIAEVEGFVHISVFDRNAKVSIKSDAGAM